MAVTGESKPGSVTIRLMLIEMSDMCDSFVANWFSRFRVGEFGWDLSTIVRLGLCELFLGLTTVSDRV